VCSSCIPASFPALALNVVVTQSQTLPLTISAAQYMLQDGASSSCVLQFGQMSVAVGAEEWLGGALGDDDSGDPPALWILGDTFLRSYYTVRVARAPGWLAGWLGWCDDARIADADARARATRP
jgi:hypothetical protein